MTKPVILVDQDGVLADFDARAQEVCAQNGWHLDFGHPSERQKRFLTDHVIDKHHRNQLRKHIDFTPYFADLPVIEGALQGMKELDRVAEVWICSKPLDNNTSCASDKVAWVKRHLPKFHGRLILAGDKSLVQGDVLLDDAPKPKWFERATWQPLVYTQPFNSHPGSELYDLPHFKWGDPIENILNQVKDKENA